MEQQEKIKEITEKLEKGIEDLFQSENYKNYLLTMSKFTSYSLNNTLLIAMQKPDATTVAGYTTWKSLGRQVKKGEKAIQILAPIIYKKKREDEGKEDDRISARRDKPLSGKTEKILVGFKMVNVFDISSTEGEPLPEIAHKLDGTVEGYADFMRAIKEISPVPVEIKKIDGSANGYYDLKEKYIAIDSGMSQTMHCKTGIHELAHAILHDRDIETEKDSKVDIETKEVQAESVAFTVCEYFGINTSDYSFGYISGWSSGKDLKELKASMETIRNTAQIIITGINEKLEGIKMSKQKGMEISENKHTDFLKQDKPLHKKSMRH
ncbi:ArdC-like ssDNA-binding domain-containing protein [Lachnospiraceae bacterium KK002]